MQFRLATLTVVLCFGLAAVAAPLPHEAPASPGAPPAPVGALITTTAPAAPVNTPSTSGAPDTAVAPVPTDVAGMEGLLKGVLSNAEPGLAKLSTSGILYSNPPPSSISRSITAAAVGATDIIGGAIVPLIGELEATVGVAVRALHGVAPIEGDASDALNNAATDVSKVLHFAVV